MCLAVDVSTGDDAVRLVRSTAHVFGVFKIGLELFCSEGPGVVHRLKSVGASRVFLDLKLHDIPRTVGGAVRRVAKLGVDYLTVHTAGGEEMMRAAQSEAADGLKLLGVTVLTSLDEDAMRATGVGMSLTELVTRRGVLAREAGLGGLVCSPNEVGRLRSELGPGVDLVTPGIRFAGQAKQDQKRTLDPASALRQGASLLVIGRAVTGASCIETALTRLRSAVDQ